MFINRVLFSTAIWKYKSALTKNRTNGVQIDCVKVKCNVRKIMVDALWEGSKVLHLCECHYEK